MHCLVLTYISLHQGLQPVSIAASLGALLAESVHGVVLSCGHSLRVYVARCMLRSCSTMTYQPACPPSSNATLLATLQMGDSSKEVSEEDRDDAQVAKGKAMEAVGDSESGWMDGWMDEVRFESRSRLVAHAWCAFCDRGLFPTSLTDCLNSYTRRDSMYASHFSFETSHQWNGNWS